MAILAAISLSKKIDRKFNRLMPPGPKGLQSLSVGTIFVIDQSMKQSMKTKLIPSLLLVALFIFQPLYPAHSTDLTPRLQRAELQFTEQISQRPDINEASLNVHERWMLSKILFSLTWRGLVFGAQSLIGQVLPLDVNLANHSRDLSEERIKQYELNILLFFKSLVDRNALAPYLRAKLEFIARLPFIGSSVQALSSDERDKALQFIVSNIEGAVRTRGLTNDSRHIPYVEWTTVSQNYINMMSSGDYSSYEIEGISSVDEARILRGGGESFALRNQLFDGAKETIDILVWAVYDDMTGDWLLNKIRQKKNEGVTVRLIVDGQVSQRSGYHQKVEAIRRLGVQVIRWQNPAALFVGQHQKLIIVDGLHTITGGINFGDEYSGMNSAVPMWLDTDIYLKGKFSRDVAQKYFNRFWDEAVSSMNLSLPTSPQVKFDDYTYNSHSSQQKQVLLLDHDPVKHAVQGSPIYRAMMNDLRLATKTIDIENAYVVVIPAFVEAVKAAVQRGVRVRVYTNSTDSVDEKVIGEVMMISAQKLMDAGAEVHLRRGTTLHSKMMIVDQERSYMMSYNLHPRSEKMEKEMAVRIDDAGLARELTAAFENEIKSERAYRVTDRESLNIPMSLKLWLLMRLMYDQL